MFTKEELKILRDYIAECTKNTHRYIDEVLYITKLSDIEYHLILKYGKEKQYARVSFRKNTCCVTSSYGISFLNQYLSERNIFNNMNKVEIISPKRTEIVKHLIRYLDKNVNLGKYKIYAHYGITETIYKLKHNEISYINIIIDKDLYFFESHFTNFDLAVKELDNLFTYYNSILFPTSNTPTIKKELTLLWQ